MRQQQPHPSSAAATALPPLLFGEQGAVVETDIRRFSDRMSQVMTALRTYDVAEHGQAFASKTKVLSLKGIKVAASANTGVVVDVGDSHDLTLMPVHYSLGNGSVITLNFDN